MNDHNPQPQPPSTLRDHLKVGRNVFGLVLMVVGVICFALFHFLEIHDDHGWQLWIELARYVRSEEVLRSREALLGFSGFITLSIGTIASPLLVGWMIHNAWIKWSLAVFNAMAAGIMWYFTIESGETFLIILALTASFTLAGLLCIKTVPRLPLTEPRL